MAGLFALYDIYIYILFSIYLFILFYWGSVYWNIFCRDSIDDDDDDDDDHMDMTNQHHQIPKLPGEPFTTGHCVEVPKCPTAGPIGETFCGNFQADIPRCEVWRGNIKLEAKEN